MAEEKKDEEKIKKIQEQAQAFVGKTAENGVMFLQNLLNVIVGSYQYYSTLFESSGETEKAKATKEFVEKVADANWALLESYRDTLKKHGENPVRPESTQGN